MSRKSANRSFRPRAIAVSVAFSAVVLLGATTADDPSVLEARRHKIEMMGQSELNKLKRNYEKYVKMSLDRREQLAHLNDELEQDAKTGGHLQKLLDQYNAWLFKLSPFDREKLQGTADPGERAQLVQKLLQEQKQRLARAVRAPFPLLGLRLDGNSATLSASELDVVLTAVEQNFLNDQAKKRLARTFAARDHHIQIVRLTMDQLRRGRETGTKILPSETALVNVILEAIPNPSVKSQITRSGMPQQIRKQLGHLLARSLMVEWKPELEEASVSGAQLDEAIDKWLTDVPAARREAIQERLQSANGRKFVGAVVALQTNPRLKKPRQPILWLLRSFPAPPSNRPNRAGGQAASPGKAAENATTRPADDSEKESSATE